MYTWLYKDVPFELDRPADRQTDGYTDQQTTERQTDRRNFFFFGGGMCKVKEVYFRFSEARKFDKSLEYEMKKWKSCFYILKSVIIFPHFCRCCLILFDLLAILSSMDSIDVISLFKAM